MYLSNYKLYQTSGKVTSLPPAYIPVAFHLHSLHNPIHLKLSLQEVSLSCWGASEPWLQHTMGFGPAELERRSCVLQSVPRTNLYPGVKLSRSWWLARLLHRVNSLDVDCKAELCIMCSSSSCCVVWKLLSGPLTCTFVSIVLVM